MFGGGHRRPRRRLRGAARGSLAPIAARTVHAGSRTGAPRIERAGLERADRDGVAREAARHDVLGVVRATVGDGDVDKARTHAEVGIGHVDADAHAAAGRFAAARIARRAVTREGEVDAARAARARAGVAVRAGRAVAVAVAERKATGRVVTGTGPREGRARATRSTRVSSHRVARERAEARGAVVVAERDARAAWVATRERLPRVVAEGNARARAESTRVVVVAAVPVRARLRERTWRAESSDAARRLQAGHLAACDERERRSEDHQRIEQRA